MVEFDCTWKQRITDRAEMRPPYCVEFADSLTRSGGGTDVVDVFKAEERSCCTQTRGGTFMV